MGLISVRLDAFQPRRLLEAALDVLFPPQCAGCGALGAIWCSACQARLRCLPLPVCGSCGAPVKAAVGKCPRCSEQALRLHARAYAWYQPPLDSAILRLKYRRDTRLANVMAGWLTELYRREDWNAELISAVPLSASRLSQRGYNQASLLGRALGARLGVPFDDQVLRRTRETGSQVGLNAAGRRLNVAGAFAAESTLSAGRSVLVVDDLFTTGATLEACAEALLAAGARIVYGLTLGRAGRMTTASF